MTRTQRNWILKKKIRNKENKKPWYAGLRHNGKKNCKKSTRKMISLMARDFWDYPNKDKMGRKLP